MCLIKHSGTDPVLVRTSPARVSFWIQLGILEGRYSGRKVFWKGGLLEYIWDPLHSGSCILEQLPLFILAAARNPYCVFQVVYSGSCILE